MSEAMRRLRPAESDADALSRIARGELDALGQLYDRHYVGVLRFVQGVTRDRADAEDLAQETFLTAARIAQSFDGRASCRPWLFGIAARLLLHRRRSVARLRRFVARLTSHPETERAPSPHERLDRRQTSDRLEQALLKLSDEKRIVLAMIEIEELTGEEVAAALGIPVGTVWTRLHHARRELRKRLAKEASS